MNLPEICIKRPVLATMLNLTLVLFGLVSLLRLPVRELPDIDPPLISVTTVYPGANAEVVETEVTERLEDVINGVEGIKKLTSESREQVSTITVEFDLSRDIDFAAQDVRDRVARIRGQLPEDIEEPIVAKQEADAQPMMWVALFSSEHSPLELADIAENQLQDRLATVGGVSSVILGGVKRYAIRIRLDSEKMAARQVTVMDVEEALHRQNVELPSGRVENVNREMTIQLHGEFKSPEQFNQMVIRKDGNALIRLSDIGGAEVGEEDERTVARYNSKEAVGLGVVRQSKANAIEVAHGIKEELDRIKPTLPSGVETFIAYDESIYVEKSIKEVWLTLLIAFILVVITIFAFLGAPRSTLVPTLTIPVALIGTFSILTFMGYSVNILTMLALVLAIGMVVDDSIVVLENIYRHVEEGHPPMRAAFLAMKQILFAVIVTTITLVSVFLPLVFQTSVTGRLFVEFAFTLCGSVVISTFVALSLTPMVASRILKPKKQEEKPGIINQTRERHLNWIGTKYIKTLRWCLGHKRKVVAGTLGVAVLGLVFYSLLDNDFLPEEDKGRLFSIAIAPEGATSEYTDRMVRQMENIISSYPETAGYFSAVALSRGGPGLANQGLMFVRFKEDRNRSLQDMMAGPNGIGARFFNEVEGAIAIPIMPKAVVRGWGQPYQLVLMHPDLKKLNNVSQEIVGELQKSGVLTNVRSQFTFNKPQLSLTIDRDRAAALGVSVEDVSKTLQILFGGLDLSKIKRGGKEYDVIVQLARESRQTPADLNRLFVRGEGGRLIQLNSIVSFNEEAAPNAIHRFNRQRSATIEATPLGVPMGVAMEKTEEILKSKLPEGFRTAWDGEAADLVETGNEGFFIIALAVLIIYIVLASQFESLVHPFTVMIALPLGIVGGLGLLWALSLVNAVGSFFYGWSHYAPNAPWIADVLSFLVPRIPAMNINLFSMIGFLLLLGMVTKNSILLVEFANQMMDEGMNAADAILEAGRLRLRPILMTAFSTIAGIAPIAIGFGAGAEGRRPMGIVIVGGMAFSTILTLFIVPVVYVLMDRFNFRRGKHASPPHPEPNGHGKTVKKAATAIVFLVLAAPPLRAAGTTEYFTLERALNQALDTNFQIRSAREEMKRQHNIYVETRGGLLPNITGTGNYTKVDVKKLPTLNGARVGTEERWTARVEATQSLFVGGQDVLETMRDRNFRAAAIHAMQSVVNDVVFQVHQQFYQVLVNKARVTVREQAIDLLEQELESEKKKLEAGIVSNFNVLRAEVALANAQTPYIQARDEYKLSLEDFRRVIGLPHKKGDETIAIELVGDLQYAPVEPDLEDMIAQALAHRPELKQLQKEYKAGRRDVWAARSDFLPDVKAFGAYEEGTSSFGRSTWDTDEGWEAGVRGEWNIFSGFSTFGRAGQAKARRTMSAIELEEAELIVEIEARRAYSSLIEAVALAKASEKVVEQAEESLRLAQVRFDEGVSTQLDLLDSQVALTEARTNKIQALFQFNVALARQRRATGEFVRSPDRP